LYGPVAAGLGVLMLWRAVQVMTERDQAREPAARRLFTVTIFYLFALFAALIVERVVHAAL
jgi:protoheme IX farnesyltransferase